MKRSWFAKAGPTGSDVHKEPTWDFWVHAISYVKPKRDAGGEMKGLKKKWSQKSTVILLSQNSAVVIRILNSERVF